MQVFFISFIFVNFLVDLGTCWATSSDVSSAKKSIVYQTVTLHIPLQILKGHKLLIQLIDNSKLQKYSDFEKQPNYFESQKNLYDQRQSLYKYVNKSPEEVNDSEEIILESRMRPRYRMFHPSLPSNVHPLRKWILGKSMNKFQNKYRDRENYSKMFDISKLPLDSTEDPSSPEVETPNTKEPEDSSPIITYPWSKYHENLLDQDSLENPSPSLGYHGYPNPSLKRHRSHYSSERQLASSILSVHQSNDGVQGFIINVPLQCPSGYKQDSQGRCRLIFLPQSNRIRLTSILLKSESTTKMSEDEEKNAPSSEKLGNTTAESPDESSIAPIEIEEDLSNSAGRTDGEIKELPIFMPVSVTRINDEIKA